jgi:hypothetical protein
VTFSGQPAANCSRYYPHLFCGCLLCFGWVLFCFDLARFFLKILLGWVLLGGVGWGGVGWGWVRLGFVGFCFVLFCFVLFRFG